MKRRGKLCRALSVRDSQGKYISSSHPTETVGMYETAYHSMRGIIMETKVKEQQDKKKSDTMPEPLKTIESAPAVQAVESSPVVREGVKPLAAFWTKFTNDWAMSLQAGALAYNLLLAIFPIALALIAILGLVFGSIGLDVKDQFINGIQSVLPQQQGVSKGVISQVFSNLNKNSGILATIAVLAAIFGGSRLFITIENCFDLIYHVRPRTALRQNLMALSMLLLFVVLVPIMVVASAGPALVISLLQKTPLASIPGISVLFSLGGVLSSLFIAWLLFEAIYIVVPNQKISFRNSWRGAIVAAVLLQIFLTLFPFYAARFLGGYAGQAGFAVILIVFFYYFAVILLLGAEINAFFAERIQATPDNLAVMVHKMTSHEPKTQQEIKQQAPPSHKDERPEGAADRGQDNATSDGKGKSAKPTGAQLKRLPPDSPGKEKKQEQSTSTSPSFGTSKIGTFVEVAAGTILAMVIELIRLRRKK
ncbi:MAG: YihY/virulence factor BrkB family protein [Chloroflexi bacterium]|nr:MAG: YihY/virulence factor BrkB family protein [Chloroflexota bacterium]